MMRVLLVTSDREECGVREYSNMLIEAIRDPEVEITEFPRPDRNFLAQCDEPQPDILHLNHHAALHSSWTTEDVRSIQRMGTRVVVTQHDTYETFSIMRERGLPDFRCADALVVHEPVEGLTHGPVGSAKAFINRRVHFLHQPVPTHEPPVITRRGTVGTIGFPFPWKNYDLLCEAAAEAGWGVLIIAPGATVEQCEVWHGLCPDVEIIPSFLPRRRAIQELASCDATAFCYSTGNSGTTGALRLGLAAHRPLIAFHSRQTRDIDEDLGILWCEGKAGVVRALGALENPVVVAGEEVVIRKLAERDSWEDAGRFYTNLYHSVIGR